MSKRERSKGERSLGLKRLHLSTKGKKKVDYVQLSKPPKHGSPKPSPMESTSTFEAPESLDESTKGTTYQENLIKLIENWTFIRGQLFDIRIESMGPQTHECGMCRDIVANIILCPECGPSSYYCSVCSERVHQNTLYHMPQRWQGAFYIPIMTPIHLKRNGHNCDHTSESDMVLIDQKGRQHPAKVNFCKCEDSAITLLRHGLWPGSPVSPQVAIHLDFMELLSVLQLDCKISTKAFTDALLKQNHYFFSVSTQKKRDIYRRVVGDCLREYQFHRTSLLSMKPVVGRGFGTECPICQNNPELVSLDGNFGLVHKTSAGLPISREFCRHKDLFMADPGDVQGFLDNCQMDKKHPKSDCSDFQAGSTLRSKKKSKKLDITGLFGSVCRHDIPLLFLDMTQGERLAYPTYILQKFLHGRTDEKKLTVMYDIACIFQKHLKITKQLDLEKCIFSVPAFHSYAHNLHCQLTFGQKNIKETGLTDGEGIERLWSILRPFSRITKEMTVNNRHDFLSDCLYHITFDAIWNLGENLSRKHKKATDMVQKNERILCNKLSNLKKEKRDVQKMKEDWLQQIDMRKSRDLALTNEELYHENEQKIKKKRQEYEQAKDLKKDSIAKDIERMNKKAEGLKKKLKGRVLISKTILQSAIKKRKVETLTNLKKLAATRQFLSSSMKKYGVGQAVALRISREFIRVNDKIKKAVDEFNLFANPEDSLQLEDCLCYDNEIYTNIGKCNISSDEIQCIDALSAINRANIELSNIKQDVNIVLGYLSTFYQEIQSVLEQNNSTGMSHFLHKMLYKFEIIFSSLKGIVSLTKNDFEFPEFMQNKIFQQEEAHFVPIENLNILDDFENVYADDKDDDEAVDDGDLEEEMVEMIEELMQKVDDDDNDD